MRDEIMKTRLIIGIFSLIAAIGATVSAVFIAISFLYKLVAAIFAVVTGIIGITAIIWDKIAARKKEKELNAMIDDYEIKNPICIFISYSHSDYGVFQIPKIASYLEKHEKIEKVLYSQKDTREDFVKYMNQYLDECDGLLLFCSETSKNSEYVIDEWAAARALKKPIIPVFIKEAYIPPLFTSKIGVKFDQKKLADSVKKIYAVIKKRLGEPITFD